MRSHLTDVQKQLYGFIKECVENNGYPPTIREIQHNFGYKSINSVVSHLNRMRDKGYITKSRLNKRMTARTIQLVDRVIKVHTISSEELSNAINKLRENGYKIPVATAIELLSTLNIRIE